MRSDASAIIWERDDVIILDSPRETCPIACWRPRFHRAHRDPERSVNLKRRVISGGTEYRGLPLHHLTFRFLVDLGWMRLSQHDSRLNEDRGEEELDDGPCVGAGVGGTVVSVEFESLLWVSSLVR